jgi:hypothetical protein
MNSHRLLSLTGPLVLLGLVAVPARAVIMYSFTAFGSTATFSLPNDPTPSFVGSNYFQVNDVSINVSGIGTVIENIDFFDSAGMGGAGDTTGDALHGPVLFSGSLTNPMMLTGMFALSGTVTPDPDGPVQVSGTLDATSTTTAPPVPEPSSGLLFFTGIGAVAGALELRRRASIR